MKPGDEVIVQWDDGTLVWGIVLELDSNRKWVSIKTDKGGEMNGTYRALTEASLFK